MSEQPGNTSEQTEGIKEQTKNQFEKLKEKLAEKTGGGRTRLQHSRPGQDRDCAIRTGRDAPGLDKA